MKIASAKPRLVKLAVVSIALSVVTGIGSPGGASPAKAADQSAAIVNVSDPSVTPSPVPVSPVPSDNGGLTVPGATSGTGQATSSEQTINYPDSVDLSATDTSLPAASTTGDGIISYSIADAGTAGCSVGSSTPTFTATAYGSCQVKITASATTNFSSASKTVTVNVAGKSQPIVVSFSPTDKVLADSLYVVVNGNISPTYTVTVDPASATYCEASGIALHGLVNGPCTFTVTVAGSGLWLPTSVTTTTQVSWFTPTVTWNPTNVVAALPTNTITPSEMATTDGPGEIHYSTGFGDNGIVNTSDCTVGEFTAVIHWTKAGSCTVSATTWATGTSHPVVKNVLFTINPDPTENRLFSIMANDDNGTQFQIFSADDSHSSFNPNIHYYTVSPVDNFDASAVYFYARTINPNATIDFNGTPRAQGQAYVATYSNKTLQIRVTVTSPQGIQNIYVFNVNQLNDITVPPVGRTSTGLYKFINTGLVTETVTSVTISGDSGFTFSDGDFLSCLLNSGYVINLGFACSVTVNYTPTSAPVDGYLPEALLTETSVDAAGNEYYAYVYVAAQNPSTVSLAAPINPHFTNWTPGTLPLATLTLKSPAIYYFAPNVSLSPTSGPLPTPVANSKGAITFRIVDAGTTGCSVDRTRLVLAWNAPGTCKIAADVAATEAYRSTSGSQTIQMSGRKPATGTQVITYPDTIAFPTTTFQLPAATSNADSVFSYKVITDGGTHCTIGAVVPTMTATATGSCVIEIAAAANSSFLAATKRVTVLVTPTPQPLRVAFSPLDARFAEYVDLAVTGNMSPQVTVTVDPNSAEFCTVSGIRLSGLTNGPCTYTVSVPGIGFWLPTSVTTTSQVSWILPTVWWNPAVTTATLPTNTIVPSEMATTDGPGEIHYSTGFGDNGIANTSDCTVGEFTAIIHWTREGSCTVTATTWASHTSHPAVKNVLFTINPDPTNTLIKSMDVYNTQTGAIDGSLLTFKTPEGADTVFSPNRTTYWMDAAPTLDQTRIALRATADNSTATIKVGSQILQRDGFVTVNLDSAITKVELVVSTPQGFSRTYTLFISRLTDIGSSDEGKDTIASLRFLNSAIVNEQVTGVSLSGDVGFSFTDGPENTCLLSTGRILDPNGFCSVSVVYTPNPAQDPDVAPVATLTMTAVDSSGVTHYSYLHVTAANPVTRYSSWSLSGGGVPVM